MGKKEIRKNFRESVFKRDNHTCQVCYTKRDAEELDAHHITDRKEMPNGGYVLENGITVCNEGEGDEVSCHMQCEQYHITNGQEWSEGLHPDELYVRVGSTWTEAYEASEKL